MKGTKEDVSAGSQNKRPRSDSKIECQVPGGGAGDGCGNFGGGGGGGSTGSVQRLTTVDALSYLKEVRDMFQDKQEKYDMFLDVMKDFKAQRTDTDGVIARVKELFKGHNNLILGFNTFLPKGYEISIDEYEAPPAPPRKGIAFEEAISFVSKIKKRFQNDERVYKTFLNTLNLYRQEKKHINQVYREVAALFESHPDLLEEFTRFLPNTSITTSTQHPPGGQNSDQHFNERSSMAVSKCPIQLDKQHRRDKIITSHERDLSVDCAVLDGKSIIKVHKEQRKHAEKDRRDRRVYDQDEREHDLDYNRDLNLHHFPDKKMCAKKAEGFGLTDEFPSYDDKDKLMGMYNQTSSFCEKVKEKLGNTENYQTFLRCLHIFSNGIIQRDDLHELVLGLLGKHPDLLKEFNTFLERCEKIDGFLAGVINKKSVCSDGQLSRSSKLEDKEKYQKWEVDGSKERERHRDKYIGKSIQELDLNNCESCTPSYRRLPEDYLIPKASQRSELGAQVLNDHWVSVTSGSEDYSFKHMRKNQYEESLFRCEDDRFEMDMLLESVSSAAKYSEELYNSITEKKINMEGPLRIEEHFSVLNLRCIERLYGDHGLDVLEALRKNPTPVLPVILARLKQKQEEWSRCRSDFNKVWAEIYAKNHNKSLDHRSFYFKQQDPKNLNPKTLVAEINEIKEKQQKFEDILPRVAAGIKQPLTPHLEFEYSDVGIHEDLYKLVLYSCEEVLSNKELSNKILRLWTNFLEPMLLGISSQSHGAVDVEERIDGHNDPDFAASNIGDAGVPVGDSLLMTSRRPKSDNIEGDGRVSEIKSVHHGDAPMDEEQKDLGCSDKHAGFRKQFSSEEQGSNYNASLGVVNRENSLSTNDLEMTSGCILTPSCPTGTLGDDDSVAKSHSGNVSLVERQDIATPVPSAHGDLIVGSKQKELSGPCKIDKEEGELSPTTDGDSEDDAFVGEANVQATPKSNLNLERSKYQFQNGEDDCCLESGVQINADADDEGFENISEAGIDVSGNESDGDECSHEDREGEESAEHDDIDRKAEIEDEAEGMCNAYSSGVDGLSLPLSERSLLSAKPLAKRVSAVPLAERRQNSRVFYGNDDFFVLFRLHKILYERILTAKTNSMSSETRQRIAKDTNSPNPYSRFMNALYKLLDGSADNAKFEDECRAIIGNQSYMLFTLDKLIYKLVRHLQAVATDDIDNKLLQLFEYEKSRKPQQLIDSVYYANARVILQEENIYRVECSSGPSQLSIRLMDNMTEKPEVFALSVDPNFADYLDNDFLSVFPGEKEPHGIILQRNKRKHGDLDEDSAMEGVKIINGLECNISCNSSKISYVLDTEDMLYRARNYRQTSSATTSSKHHRARVERFHKFLSGSN